jgi:hypothetical protein
MMDSEFMYLFSHLHIGILHLNIMFDNPYQYLHFFSNLFEILGVVGLIKWGNWVGIITFLNTW